MQSSVPKTSTWLRLEVRPDYSVISPIGSWRLVDLEQIDRAVDLAELAGSTRIAIDGEQLEDIDTAGAMLLFHKLRIIGVGLEEVELFNFAENPQHIFELVREKLGEHGRLKKGPRPSLLHEMGAGTVHMFCIARDVLSFIGQTGHEAFHELFCWRDFRVKEFFIQLEHGCIRAIPIVLLLNFLIGVVIAYLSSIQIEQYGANIYIVDGVSLAMVRELSPILVAIIVAGRSGSAFTAQIGAMKLNDEIDAIVTLGLSPMRVLVLPRIYALMISMPLLVFLGDIIGIFGGMVIADLQLGITGTTFLQRLQVILPINSCLVGLIKAPVFAAFIAAIGCRMGLTVEKNARSVGMSTTSTVVQSIVAVILLNAAFAVIFVELGI